MSVHGGARYRNPLRNLGRKRMVAIEQAVARDWSVGRCVAELGVTEAQCWAVRDAMDEAVRVAT